MNYFLFRIPKVDHNTHSAYDILSPTMPYKKNLICGSTCWRVWLRRLNNNEEKLFLMLWESSRSLHQEKVKLRGSQLKSHETEPDALWDQSPVSHWSNPLRTLQTPPPHFQPPRQHRVPIFHNQISSNHTLLYLNSCGCVVGTRSYLGRMDAVEENRETDT